MEFRQTDVRQPRMQRQIGRVARKARPRNPVRKDVESITPGDLMQQTGFTEVQLNEDLIQICGVLESSYDVVLFREKVLR